MVALLKKKYVPNGIKPILKNSVSADDINLLKLNFHIDSLEIKSKKSNSEAIKLFDFLDQLFDKLDQKNSSYKYINLMYEKLSRKIDEFESGHYSVKKLSPPEKLNSLLIEHDLKQKDLVDCIGSQGYVSDVLKGKRAINVEMAKKLGAKFSLSPAYFLDI